jgi:hypothetical protein
VEVALFGHVEVEEEVGRAGLGPAQSRALEGVEDVVEEGVVVVDVVRGDGKFLSERNVTCSLLKN